MHAPNPPMCELNPPNRLSRSVALTIVKRHFLVHRTSQHFENRREIRSATTGFRARVLQLHKVEKTQIICWNALFFAIATGLSAAAQPPRPNHYLGREIAPFMSADGAAWLTRETREREEQPQLLLKALKLKPDQKVCDFGCGNGYYSLELAKRVGPTGEVWAVDIQQEMLDLLAQRTEARELKSIRPTLATETDPRLPKGELDLVLMVDVYHELSHPAEVLAAVRKSLNPTGTLVLVEFREEDPNVPIKPLHKMSQTQVMKELSANGYKLVAQFDELPWQHVMWFADRDSRTPETRLVPWRPAGAMGVKLPESPSPPSGEPLPGRTNEPP